MQVKLRLSIYGFWNVSSFLGISTISLKCELMWICSPSAPCVPTDVMVTRTCGKTSAKVKWNDSRGALHYEAAAVDEAGQPLLCSSNQTSCTLEGLVCSQVYSVGVTATDDTCTSNKSSAVILQTGIDEQESISKMCLSFLQSMSYSSMCFCPLLSALPSRSAQRLCELC